MSTATPPAELPKQYDHQQAQQRWYAFWEERGYFHGEPGGDRKPLTIVIPPPNVTGALHLGHALNNTLQDILVRMRRMQGYNALWMPGTDHAGIATQAVVERRLLEEEGKSRHDLGREALVERIWAWKDQYEQRIIGQLKQMGCSCDWQRTRFTLDDTCARAVRETFFKMFQDGLIYRGKRLVNWDTFLQTAVSDDEVFHETVQGHFWHIKYPVIDPLPGEPTHVTIATTRPETMLGDTAVAVHPDPAKALAKVEAELKDKLAAAPTKGKKEIEAQLEELAQRRKTVLPLLVQLRDMARDGRRVMLPLVDREIPLILDEWAKPELGSGCVKITPAHDPNDYEVRQRHPEIGAVNILHPDGTLNENAGQYQGQTVAESRQNVVADLDALGLLEETEDREIDLAHSDRSKTPIEPYLADQWFVEMDQLAQSAMDAVSDGRVKIVPERYAKAYLDWLSEKRDWCISRNLWWGHRIPVWHVTFSSGALGSLGSTTAIQNRTANLRKDLQEALDALGQVTQCEGDFSVKRHVEGSSAVCFVCTRSREAEEQLADITRCLPQAYHVAPGVPDPPPWLPIPDNDNRHDAYEAISKLEFEWRQDPDVLDTWFSSALWPHSTLGWPEKTEELAYYYPTSVLITSRDIITLWVARMVLTGLYNVGDVPFHEVYIHPKILDGYGETMSKSKGNGVDPLDVIEKFGADALRFALAYMTTEQQDVRMPVEFECPHCQALIQQTRENRLLPRIKCGQCGGEFSTQWARADSDDARLPRGAVVSERFELGRNFCNKLWNASRFALMNLQGYEPGPVADDDLMLEDRWILSRLWTVTGQVTGALSEGNYRYAEAARTLYDFAWDEFCSFYIEMVKGRLADAEQRPVAQRVLASTLDILLRLLHPFIPFLTEEVWQLLGQVAPRRGLPSLESELLADMDPSANVDWRQLYENAAASVMIARWPNESETANFSDQQIEARFARFQEVLKGIREIRSRHNIPPRAAVHFAVRCSLETAELLEPMAAYFRGMAGAEATGWGEEVEPPLAAATFSLPGIDVYVDLAEHIDLDAEIHRKEQELAKIESLITAKKKKLANENFTARAPADVVRRERDALDQLTLDHAATATAIESLVEERSRRVG